MFPDSGTTQLLFNLGILGLVITFLTKHGNERNFQVQAYEQKLTKRALKTDIVNSSTQNSTKNSKFIPFYIYTGPEFNFYNQCIQHHDPEGKPSRKFGYRNYKHATGMRFLEGIFNHKWRIFDPNQAKIFVVPALISEVLRKKQCKGVTSARMIERLEKGLSESVFWRKNNGIDHVLVDTDYIFSRYQGSLTKYIKNTHSQKMISNPTMGFTKSLRKNAVQITKNLKKSSFE